MDRHFGTQLGVFAQRIADYIVMSLCFLYRREDGSVSRGERASCTRLALPSPQCMLADVFCHSMCFKRAIVTLVFDWRKCPSSRRSNCLCPCGFSESLTSASALETPCSFHSPCLGPHGVKRIASPLCIRENARYLGGGGRPLGNNEELCDCFALMVDWHLRGSCCSSLCVDASVEASCELGRSRRVSLLLHFSCTDWQLSIGTSSRFRVPL